MSANTTEVHERKHRIVIDHKALAEVVAKAAAQMVEFGKPRIGAKGTEWKVEFEDATEGSPAYRVGTKAIVTIVEDLLPQVEEVKPC